MYSRTMVIIVAYGNVVMCGFHGVIRLPRGYNYPDKRKSVQR